MEYWSTIKVCQDCMLHDANGECGGCHSDEGHDREPWSTWENETGFYFAMGIRDEDHHYGCNPGGCDCGNETYSTSQCKGCGSYLHGARYAFTVFHV